MSGVSQLALLFIGAALVNNILMTRFIGLCPFFGVSGNMETSIGMSLSVIFVMMMASTATWVVWEFVLAPLGVGEFLYIPAFILIIASLVQFVEMYLRKASPVLYRAMGIYLPLITTNCAVLAIATESAKPGFFKMNIAITNSAGALSLGEALVYTLGVSVGFGFALVTFADAARATRSGAGLAAHEGLTHRVHHRGAAFSVISGIVRLVRPVR